MVFKNSSKSVNCDQPCAITTDVSVLCVVLFCQSHLLQQKIMDKRPNWPTLLIMLLC